MPAAARTEPELEFVTSADGTPIAYVRDGRGPALVIVTGAFQDRRSSAPLAAGLRGRFTIHRFDRRGRGDSGDTPPWDVAREVEDLAAVIAVTGETPFVYGHSSGAALAIEAAAAQVPMQRLFAYEPPYTGPRDVHASQRERLDALVAAGEIDGAVELFLRGAGTPPGVLARLRASPGWAQMLALGHVLPYDVGLTNGGELPIDRVQRIAIPVIGAAGGLSPDWAHVAADALAAVAPQGQSLLVEGQTHGATAASLLPHLTAFFH
jgi:pimeloyl-ACP methyl ester carboxylesterase